MAFLAPALLVALSALAIPVVIHLVQRERRRVVPFPSLMFLRRIPYQSVRRRRIRDWLLLAVRMAALLLIVLAFARPFFPRGAIASAAIARGGREVVILLDRSASMAYGDHWARAQKAATDAVAALGSADRATLVLFDATAEETVRATDNRARLDEAIRNARPGSVATRYAPALKLAMSVLARSSLPRREAVLVSDFQKSGWRGDQDVRFPQGMLLTPVSISSGDVTNVSITSVSLARAPFAGKERVTITAAIRNQGAATKVPASLQVGDNVVETIPTTIAANTSSAVTFAPFTLGTPGLTATVRAGSDALPGDNVFRLVLAPSPAVSVLLVEPDEGAGLYLKSALAIGSAPAFQVDEVSVSRLSPAALEHHPVVVLNGVPASRIGAAALAEYVRRGAGLLMIGGGEGPGFGAATAGSTADVLPVATDDPGDAHVTTIGFVDYSHPVFEIFQGAHGGDFSGARVYRYRAFRVGRDDRVLARFSDGGIALLERRIGDGRAIVWSSTLDDSWNDLALKPVFLPFVQQVTRYLARYHEEPAWRSVGQALDLSDAGTRGGQPRPTDSTSSRSAPIVLAPSGRRVDDAGGKPRRFVELDEQGFYEVRRTGALPAKVAVNLDPAESDLARVDPQELTAAVTGHAQPTAAAGAAPVTAEDMERRQSIWWYLLFGGLLLIALDTWLANGVSALGTNLAGAGRSGRISPVASSGTKSPRVPSETGKIRPDRIEIRPERIGQADVAR